MKGCPFIDFAIAWFSFCKCVSLFRAIIHPHSMMKGLYCWWPNATGYSESSESCWIWSLRVLASHRDESATSILKWLFIFYFFLFCPCVRFLRLRKQNTTDLVAEWLKTTEMYSVTDLDARDLKSRSDGVGFSLWNLWGRILPCLFWHFRWPSPIPWRLSACSCLTPSLSPSSSLGVLWLFLPARPDFSQGHQSLDESPLRGDLILTASTRTLFLNKVTCWNPQG